MIRIFDFIFSLVGQVILSPVFYFEYRVFVKRIPRHRACYTDRIFSSYSDNSLYLY